MNSFKSLYRCYSPYKKRLWIGIVALFFVDIFHLFIPRIIKYAIDGITKGTITKTDLFHYALLIVGLALIVSVLRFFWRYYIIGTSRKIEEQLRNKLFAHIQNMDMKFFNNHKIGDLMAHATNDVNAIRETLGHGMIQFLDIIIWGPFSLAFMLFISVKLTLFAIIPLPFVSIMIMRFSKLIYTRFKNVQASFSALTANARENIEGIKVIKVFNQENGEISNFTDKSQDYMDKNMRLTQIHSIFSPMIFFFTSISTAIVLLVGGKYVISHTISMGDLVAFMSYLATFIWPTIAIGLLLNTIQRGSASMSRINEILNTLPEIKAPSDPVEIKTISDVKKLEIVNLDFYYKEKHVLDNINLSLNAGDSLGITGKIGSGKTTLLNLITRLYDPDKGEIKLNDVSLKNIPFDNLRKIVSFVPQDSFLFSDTIFANIAFGKPHATLEEVQVVAKIAKIHDEIMSFPNNYYDVIGERGVTLSGGQCQRVALSRALLLNPDVLIIDNALASIDIEKEMEILHNLRHTLKDKILIVVSHRIRSIMESDKIIVLEHGKITEKGNHNELLALQGIYFHLFRYQEFNK
ncbi:MAG: ABC transporter ATP-binding protein [bacterium]|nr:ABC transporter ATP-binding protein [bacterium]